jgi:hypothetical protein
MSGKSSQVAGDEATVEFHIQAKQTNPTMTERIPFIAFLEPAFYGSGQN